MKARPATVRAGPGGRVDGPEREPVRLVDVHVLDVGAGGAHGLHRPALPIPLWDVVASVAGTG
jgi:hypothetical protein